MKKIFPPGHSPARHPSKYAALASLGLQPATVVDIGAGRQTECLRVLYPAAHHHLYEPNLVHWPYLRLHYARHDHTLHGAVGPCHPVDLPAAGTCVVKVDTDTREVLMLEASLPHLPGAVAVVVELKGVDAMLDVLQYMQDHGWLLYDLVDHCHHDGWLHQCDGVWVRPGAVRPEHKPFDMRRYRDPWYSVCEVGSYVEQEVDSWAAVQVMW